MLRNIRNIREPGKLPAWLYSIARKTAISHMRSEYIKQTLLEKNTNIYDIKDDNNNPAFDNAELIHYGLGRISLHHGEILTLFFLQDLAVEEIANVLEVPVGTIKSRLYYAKQALKAVLEAEEQKYE